MKKVLSIILMLMCISFGSSAYDFMVDGLCYEINEYTPNQVSVTYENPLANSYYVSPGYSDINEQIQIPGKVVNNNITYNVYSVGYQAFWSCANLKYVNIQEGVRSIDSYSFDHCSGLKKIKLPTSIWYIGAYAFNHCTSLDSLILPKDIKSFNCYSLYTCSGLKILYSKIREPETVYNGGNVFSSQTKNTCVLYVPEGTREKYETAVIFRGFLHINEVKEYDINLDGVITAADVTCLYNYFLNGDNTFELFSDLNDDGVITSSDITMLYDILLGNK